MHSQLPVALGFVALAITAVPRSGQEPKPQVERLEAPRIELAPIRAMKLPALGGPDVPPVELPNIPLPLPEEPQDPYVARAGRLKLLENREVVGEPIPPPTDPDAWEEDGEESPVVVIQPEVRLAEANFDNWVFGNMNTEALRSEWLGSVLEERLASLAEAHRLTRGQVEKLRLAGKGDIKRFCVDVEAAREKYKANRSDLPKGFSALQEAVPLAMRFQIGPFADGSLLGKTLDHMTQASR